MFNTNPNKGDDFFVLQIKIKATALFYLFLLSKEAKAALKMSETSVLVLVSEVEGKY